MGSGMDFSGLRVLVPFFAPKNYSEMLWKIALAGFWFTFVCTFLVRTDPWIDGQFARVEHLHAGQAFMSTIKAPELNVGGFMLAALVMAFSRATRFHDWVSDRF